MYVGWRDDSIGGAKGLDHEGIVAAIDAGARVFQFGLVVSIFFYGLEATRGYLVRPGESPARKGALPTALTALLGWWGLGIFSTPGVLWRNLHGGVDVTDAVRAHRLALISKARARAEEAEARREAAARLAHGPGTPTERRESALDCLGARDAEAAWSILEPVLGRGTELDRDLPLLRRLVLGLANQRSWEAGYRAAAALAREFPDEAAKGYLGHQIRRIETHVGEPGSLVAPLAYWRTNRGMLSIGASAAVFFAVALNMWMRDHRELYLVNGTGQPVVIRTTASNGVSRETSLAAGKRAKLVVPEGALRFQSRRGEQEVDRTYRFESGFFARFLDGFAVFNVEGGAILVRREVGYAAANAAPPEVEPPTVSIGEEFHVYEGVRHFGSAPASVRLGRNETQVRVEVFAVPGRPHQALRRMPAPTSDAQLRFAELHLRLTPGDGKLLDAYVELASSCGAAERAEQFLASEFGGQAVVRDEAIQRLREPR